jgi:thymidylate synthase
MKQYLKLLGEIKNKGTQKPGAREGMPGTLSLFGYQFRHDLSEGFPILTTKEINFKNIVYELLWFLQGETNIKYLVDRGVNIWNEDAYNYYKNHIREYSRKTEEPSAHLLDDGKVLRAYELDEFVKAIKESPIEYNDEGYTLGDCGFQYGRTWRGFGEAIRGHKVLPGGSFSEPVWVGGIDQIQKVIDSLRESPQGRRHIVSAIDPNHDTPNDLALYWCHALFQFNCRPLTDSQKEDWLMDHYREVGNRVNGDESIFDEEGKLLDSFKETYSVPADRIPKYYLDCQMYQRSADVFLGVPYNIASYALLTHIVAKICNMVPGDYIHTFGDVHIYDNHVDQIEEQLNREPFPLPQLEIYDEGNDWAYIRNTLDFSIFDESDFTLKNYNHHEKIKGKLSTGLK